MQIKVDQQTNGTIIINVQTTAEEGMAAKNEVLQRHAGSFNIQGFRPGKAPLPLIEQNFKADKLAEKTLSILASRAYEQAGKEHDLKPITQPSVSMPAAKDTQTPEETLKAIWPKAVEEGIEIEILTFTTPTVELGDWEKSVKSVKSVSTIETATSVADAKAKASKDDTKADDSEAPAQDPERALEEQILNALLEAVKFDVPDALVRGEADHMLMHHIETIQRLGVSYNDYLKSQDKTLEDIHNELIVEAEKTLRTRFILSQIAKKQSDFFKPDATLKDVVDYLKKVNTGEKIEPLSEEEKHTGKHLNHADHDHNHDHDHSH